MHVSSIPKPVTYDSTKDERIVIAIFTTYLRLVVSILSNNTIQDLTKDQHEVFDYPPFFWLTCTREAKVTNLANNVEYHISLCMIHLMSFPSRITQSNNNVYRTHRGYRVSYAYMTYYVE